MDRRLIRSEGFLVCYVYDYEPRIALITLITLITLYHKVYIGQLYGGYITMITLR